MSQPSRGAAASYGKDVEVIDLRFWPNNTSTTTLTRVSATADATAGGFMDAGGVASVTRTSNAGEFTVVLEKGYQRVLSATATVQKDTAADLVAQVGTFTNEGTPASAFTFLVRLLAGATGTDLAADVDNSVSVHLVLQQSSEPR
jgi:hypothetical protein